MHKEEIIIANLKCNGCEKTIKNKLNEVSGVKNVEIVHDEDKVIVTGNDNLNREELITKLHSIGYPEATEENGLLLQLKSYASCISGRLRRD